ncbi:hypothetical protein HJFPF1_08414 [Paramyrothecium foliicola]|nr:hypothetical protein HJFPF1_13659 [Paramyrothecium foliicola]KAI9155825.1 hypothetical protein HJFPF1_08414 [Paramyrothecium foliicola]
MADKTQFLHPIIWSIWIMLSWSSKYRYSANVALAGPKEIQENIPYIARLFAKNCRAPMYSKDNESSLCTALDCVASSMLHTDDMKRLDSGMRDQPWINAGMKAFPASR